MKALLFGLALLTTTLFIGAVPTESKSATEMKEPVWQYAYNARFTDSKNYFSIQSKKGNLVTGQTLVQYRDKQSHRGVEYTTRVSGIEINCESARFAITYDLYYKIPFPGLYSDAVAAVSYEKPAILETRKSTLLYQVFCAIET